MNTTSNILEAGHNFSGTTMLADRDAIIKDNASKDEIQIASDKEVLASSEKILQRNKAVYDKLA